MCWGGEEQSGFGVGDTDKLEELRAYVKDVEGELLDAARHQRRVLRRAVEVQVEPVGQFDLKAHAYEVGALLDRDVDDETARQIVQNVGGDLVVLFVVVLARRLQRRCGGGDGGSGCCGCVCCWC